jgi:choline-sulfatase
MKLNRKQKLFIFILFFFVFIGEIRFLYCSNKSEKLNILLITLDALRPDHLGCYGYKRNTSPNIDKLVKEGVLFTQAISQASWTCPSLYSIITATYSSTHGVNFWDQLLSPSVFTLSQILKKNDFYTCFISGHGALSRFNLGFDSFKDISGNAEQITREAIQIFEKNKNKKFFLWIHYMDMHDKSLGIPEEKHYIKNVTKEEINNYIFEYDKSIRYVDNQIALLLRKLKELELYRNTILIITADHGQEICEHELCFNHGGFLWDSVIKVPLIIFCTKFLPKNRIIRQQVQHIDLFPTICDILRIKKPKTIEGRSFLSLIKGKDNLPDYAFSEHKENDGDLSTGAPVFTKLSIRSSVWKFIYTYGPHGEEYELYNLKNDSQELNNLANLEKEQFKFLKAKLEEWMNRAKPEITSLAKPLDKETKERLKSLGYLQ